MVDSSWSRWNNRFVCYGIVTIHRPVSVSNTSRSSVEND